MEIGAVAKNQTPNPRKRKRKRTIVEIRQELKNCLGSDYPKYIKVLQDWFANKSLRGEFILNAPFLRGHLIKLHNEFLIAMLTEASQPDRVEDGISEPEPVPQQIQLSESVTESPDTSFDLSIDIEEILGASGNEFGDEFNDHDTFINPIADTAEGIAMHSSTLNKTSYLPVFELPLSRQCIPEPKPDPVVSWQEVLPQNTPVRVASRTKMTSQDLPTIAVATVKDEQEESKLTTVYTFSTDRDFKIIEFLPKAGTDKRFPLVKDLKQNPMTGTKPNITHLVDVDSRLKKVPASYFKTKPADTVVGPRTSFTTRTTVQGKFYLKAWEKGIQNVTPGAVAVSIALEGSEEEEEDQLFPKAAYCKCRIY